MDLITELFISINWKSASYDSILIIVDWPTKMVYYKPVQTIIDAPGVVEVIINVIV